MANNNSYTHSTLLLAQSNGNSKRGNFISLLHKVTPKLHHEALNGAEIALWMTLHDFQFGQYYATPDQRRIATLLNTTQSTISRRMKVLRALRLITLLPENKLKSQIRSRQRICVHEKPQPVDKILRFDQNFIAFLAENTHKGNQRFRQICREELYAIPKQTLLQYNIVLAALYSNQETETENNLNKKEKNSEKTISFTQKPPHKSRYASVMHEEGTVMHPLCTSESRYASVHNGKNPEYTYNRGRAPAQRRIKNLKIFNNNHTPLRGGCGGGGHFQFFDEKPTNVLVEKLQCTYNRTTAHAVLNHLKRGHYTHLGRSFKHQITADEANIILISLLSKLVKYPIPYVTALLLRASQEELTFQGEEITLWRKITDELRKQQQLISNQTRQAKMDAIDLPDGTVLIGKKSGKSYKVKAQSILGGGDKRDGVHPYAVTDITQIRALIVTGNLKIKAKA